jgi:hypothetical protein
VKQSTVKVPGIAGVQWLCHSQLVEDIKIKINLLY